MGHEQHKGNDEQSTMVRLNNTIKLFSTGTYDGQQPDRVKGIDGFISLKAEGGGGLSNLFNLLRAKKLWGWGII